MAAMISLILGMRATEIVSRVARDLDDGGKLLGIPDSVGNICRPAGAPSVSAYGMRRLHSTLTMGAGVTGAVVAESLGHESVTTTVQSYAKPDAVSSARQKRTLAVLQGGLGTQGTG